MILVGPFQFGKFYDCMINYILLRPKRETAWVHPTLISFYSQKYAVCSYCNLDCMEQFVLKQTRLAKKKKISVKYNLFKIYFIKEKHFRSFVLFHLCEKMFHNAVFLLARMSLNVTGSLMQIYLLPLIIIG